METGNYEHGQAPCTPHKTLIVGQPAMINIRAITRISKAFHKPKHTDYFFEMTEMVHPPVAKSLQKLLVQLETLVETYRIEQNSSLEAQPCNAVEGTSKKEYSLLPLDGQTSTFISIAAFSLHKDQMPTLVIGL